MTGYPNNLLNENVRDAFPILKEVVYLNTGTYGIMPQAALAEFQRIQGEFEWRGLASDGSFHRKAEETRKRIADLINAKPEEISFNRNATDGINLVLAGIDWKPGDEVITTVQEHEAMIHPLSYLIQTRGLVVKRVEVSPNADVMLAELDAVATERTRLVAMSLVSCETGTRIPGKAISQWAAEHNILCLYDGAQASGAMKVDVQELGCDFYASNGHKWLCGPKGTGFFYGRLEKLALLSPAHVGAGSLQKVDIQQGIAEPFLTGQRFEYGTRAWAVYAGLGCSLDWFESLGWKNVYAHIASLSSYLKDCILERPFLRLLTPESFEESSGLTSFVIEGHNAGEVQRELHEKWKISTRVIPHYNAMRLSTTHFNNPDDVNKIMTGIEEICVK
jgi:selenocysteine lyase/cysteine desulfurase